MQISNKKHITSNHMVSFKQSQFREKELSDRVTVSGDRPSEYDVNAQKLRDMAKKNDIKSATEQHISSLNLDNYMIPANHGRVAHMCLTFDGYDTKHNYVTAMKTFISKMPEAKFTVLARSKSDRNYLQEQVDDWAKKGIIENPERVNIINTGKNLSIWAQDSTLVIGNKVVEQDRTWFPGSDDGAVAGEIAEADSSLEYEKLEGIYIDGGNQLATDDTLFVGSDAVKFMLEDMKPYPSIFKKVVNFFKGKDNPRFSEKYERLIDELHIDNAAAMNKEDLCTLMMEKTFPHQKIVVVGHKGEQPSFHIDMAMTPLGKADPETGRPVITVGDPSMAVDILRKLKKEEPDKYSRYEKEIRKKLDFPERHPLDSLMCSVTDDLQENFDSLAKEFEHNGYKIERVPYLGSSDIKGVPWITYNNSVIDGDNIFIPNFAIPELDNIGNGIYKKYGYNPVPIDMTSISSLSGAINCITKVLERVY